MLDRSRSFVALFAAAVIALAAGPPQPAALGAGYVRLQVRAANPDQLTIVRVTIIESDPVRANVREHPLPVSLEVPGLSVRIQVEPVNRSIVTTTVAEFWYGGLPVTRGEVMGVGAELQVEQGNLVIRTSPKHGAIVPLGQQP